ncbi:Clp protease N-terminal domain-containing protein [Streptomyces brasiliensis]|uniref:Clp R domain-containing protein n=1 Tax=Streptomyces brasiliensis TaxID=1954 RepID=A0A917KLD1_9ACTN|nr:Clp protease N-terminal domain-containing protein [Streptomyces brasiliensis]GGJ14193.1 hypothetical protein GCM10010121_025980 [Streptomyces brasiliensis]
MSAEPTADQLITAARARAGSDDELALLDAVIAVTHDLSRQADTAVDEVVRRARAAGHSWTVIGERLGVSRQAARQRYADRVERIREAEASGTAVRARDLESSLSAALAAAGAEGLAEAGTEHMLLGLLTDGVAAAALEQLGVTRDKIRDASRRLFDHPTGRADTSEPVFSGEAEAALAAAEHLATERTPACAPVVVTTPQLLAVLATNPGSRARRVLNDLGVDVADVKRLVHCYTNVPRTPFGRRGRRGRPKPTGR